MPSPLLTFRTRQQKETAKQKGRIEGYFGKIAKGRPRILKDQDGAVPAMMATATQLQATAVTMKAKAKAPKYENWAINGNFERLKSAVVANINKEATDSTLESISTESGIPRPTLHRHTKKMQAIAADTGIAVDRLPVGLVFPVSHRGSLKPALLNEDEVKLLASAIIHRDEANNGMSRQEVGQLILEMSQTSSMKKAMDHYDYLVRNRRLIGVKNGGHTVKAQATTTVRSQIQVEQQLRWHTTIDEALQEQRRLNQPALAFEQYQDDFFGNLDETCLMSNADGDVRVIAAESKKKTEKNTDDSRVSITSIRVGMASGIQGPFTFLAKGVRMDRPSLKKLLKDKAPAGSSIHMSPSAYMTDEVYDRLVPGLCAGIREMPVIKDHPEWWVVLSMDGFGSHVNVNRAQQTFHDHRILVIKEEGDSSHVNQAYDQFVAKQVSVVVAQHICFLHSLLLTQHIVFILCSNRTRRT